MRDENAGMEVPTERLQRILSTTRSGARVHLLPLRKASETATPATMTKIVPLIVKFLLRLVI